MGKLTSVTMDPSLYAFPRGCTCTIEDVTSLGDARRSYIQVPDPGCRVHGDDMRERAKFEATIGGLKLDQAFIDEILAKPGLDEADRISDVEPVTPTCCDKPKPRIHHGSSRFFCASCRRWLDRPIKEFHDDSTATQRAGRSRRGKRSAG